MIQLLFLPLIFSQEADLGSNYIGYFDKAGNSGAVCVHTILLPPNLPNTNPRILCVERAHTLPYTPNPFTKAAVAVEIDLKAKVNDDGTWESAFTVVPVDSSPFCGGHSQRADGNILFVGGDNGRWEQMDGTLIEADGHKHRRLYNACVDQTCSKGTWVENELMSTGRWYPSVTTLYNGNQIIVGGVVGNIDMNKPEGNNPTYEYYPSKEGAWPKQLDLLSWCFPFCLYPTVTQLPSGSVFIMASNKSITLNPETEELKFNIPDLIAPDQMPWIYPHTPAFTILPLTKANKYRFVIQACGGSVASEASTTKLASKQCWQIAPNDPNPKWERQDDMPHARVMPDAVILPDGNILYLNGAEHGTAGGNAGESLYTADPVYAADLFDPTAPRGKQWKTLASASILRLYHSEAILVQTGHVIVTGSEQMNLGDYWGGGNSDPQCYPKGLKACTSPFNYELERFTPPYLQRAKSSGRPEIVSSPVQVEYNTEFDITLKNSAKDANRVVLVRYSTVTHSINMDQRLMELSVISRNDKTVRVRSPWGSAIAPPGNWMLWVLNKDNVPSESRTIKLMLGNDGKFNFFLQDPNPTTSTSFTGYAGSAAVALVAILFVL